MRLHNFLFIFLILLLFSLLKPVYGSETRTDQEFFRINGDLNIVLSEQPAYFYSASFSEIPTDNNFIAVENSQKKWRTIGKSDPHWIRIIVENKSAESKSLFLKAGQFPCDIYVYNRDSGNNWTSSRIGILVPDDDSLDSFYPACKINLKPGPDTLYIYNADTWSTFVLSFLRISDEEGMRFDKSDFIAATGNFTFYLFAFNALIAFQIIYIILQSYYHRKSEYREYLFYLLAILIYFVVRFEVYFDSSILTGNFPQLRKLLNDLMLLLPFAFYLRFSRFYIDMPVLYPQMNRNVKIAERVAFFLSVILFIMWLIDIRDEDKLYVLSCVLLFSLYSLYLIWFFIKQKNKQIGFLLIGSCAAIIGNFLGMTSSMFPSVVMYFNLEPLLFTMTGLLLEIFFFNTGLGYKAKTEQAEKLKAQETLIDQLNTNRRMHERLENMRNKIANDLHDDVGSTLSSIGLYSEVGIDQIEKNTPYVKGILEKISVSSTRMMAAMNDIVWAIHSRNDQGEGLIERIKYFAEERLGPAGIKFHLYHDPQGDHITLTMEARRNILLIFKEAINNAAKYSGSDEIKGSIVIANGFMECKIIDFGKGFKNTDQHQGNGLTTMKTRATEMKGSFSIISHETEGSTVVVIIPLSEIVHNGLYENQ